MTATAVASCPCIPDEVFCAWSGCINKLNWTVQLYVVSCRVTLQPRGSQSGVHLLISRSTFRGVTRLDGAREKKQVWRPLLETEVFRKQLYYIEKVFVTLLGLFGTPVLIWSPLIDSAPAELRLPRYASGCIYCTAATNELWDIKLTLPTVLLTFSGCLLFYSAFWS